MKRSLGWCLLVAAGLLLGVVSSYYQTTHADPPADEAGANVAKSDTLNAAMLEELKGIHEQLKEINNHLKTGVVKTFSMMNPAPDEKKE